MMKSLIETGKLLCLRGHAHTFFIIFYLQLEKSQFCSPLSYDGEWQLIGKPQAISVFI